MTGPLSDIQVENFRPATPERRDLGHDRLAAIDPRLVQGAI
ncbi:CoA transferase [Streptomyces sp. DT193]